MKAYIVKYALTTGIRLVDGEKVESSPEVFDTKNGFFWRYYYKRQNGIDEWVETKEEALEIAEKMRANRLESLKKQISALEKKKIEIKEV